MVLLFGPHFLLALELFTGGVWRPSSASTGWCLLPADRYTWQTISSARGLSYSSIHKYESGACQVHQAAVNEAPSHPPSWADRQQRGGQTWNEQPSYYSCARTPRKRVSGGGAQAQHTCLECARPGFHLPPAWHTQVGEARRVCDSGASGGRFSQQWHINWGRMVEECAWCSGVKAIPGKLLLHKYSVV